MVVEGLISNVLASVVMNGLCCVHSMQEEEARRKEHQDFVRRTIKVEYERQRLIEREIWDKQLREQGLTDAAIVAEARRKLLIAAKIQAKRQSCSAGSLVARADCSSRCDDGCQYSMAVVGGSRASLSSSKSMVPPSSMNGRVSSAPVWCVRDRTGLYGSASSVVSSLLDEDEEDEEMEQVALR